MSRRVLSVGQCAFDHGNVSRALSGQFGAQVEAAATAREALDAVRRGGYDLVLVNRVFDADGGSGLDLIREVKKEAAAVPVMLVSNFADAQEEAVKAGALPGFGKAALSAPETLARLEAHLGQ
jgi:two-component system chemotaxis response regulator CheY